MTSQARRAERHPPRSLTLAFYRHTATFLAALVLVVLLGQMVAIETEPVPWLAAGLALGLLAGLSGGWLALLFPLSGLAVGAAIDLAIRHPHGEEAAAALTAALPIYGAMVLAATVAYLALLLARRQFS